jgi:hypothetical protein
LFGFVQFVIYFNCVNTGNAKSESYTDLFQGMNE